MDIKTAIEELETLKALYEFVESVDMSKPVGAIALGIQALKNEARRLVLMDWYKRQIEGKTNRTMGFDWAYYKSRLDLLEECEIKESREKLMLYTEKDTCVCCGKYVPEGRMVCQECEERNYNGREPWNK